MESIKILELKGNTAVLRIYSDFVEGEFFGVASWGGSHYYKIGYNEIVDVDLIPKGETNYLVINYGSKPTVDNLHELPSNNNFKPTDKNNIDYNNAKKVIEYLMVFPYKQDEVNNLLVSTTNNIDKDLLASPKRSQVGIVKGLKFGVIIGLIFGLIAFIVIKNVKGPSVCECEKVTKNFISNNPESSAESFLECMDKYGDQVKDYYSDKLIGEKMSGIENQTYQLQEGDYYLYFSEKCK